MIRRVWTWTAVIVLYWAAFFATAWLNPQQGFLVGVVAGDALALRAWWPTLKERAKP